MRGLTRAFAHRNYRLFFGGQLISLTGTWMQSVAQAWLVYRLTKSSALLGLVAFSGQIPILLFAVLGGTLADRTHRHRIIVLTQTAAMVLAFVLAALTLSGHVRVWHLITLAFVLGSVYAFDIPARQAFFVDMVGREDLMNAIALNSSMVNGARIVGPAVAGAVVAAVGEGWCFFLNGVSYLAVLAGLLLMDRRLTARAVHSGRSPIVDIVEGFRFAGDTPTIRALLILLGIVSVAAAPYSVLMPIFADQILRGGAKGLGLLMGATGIGALAGALTLASRRGVDGLGAWVTGASLTVGISLLLFSTSRSFWLSVALLVPAGCSLMIHMAASNTLIQTMVPDRLRGRVMAIYSMMLMGMAPVGALLAGSIAARIGAPPTVALGGLACITASVAFGLRWRAGFDEARELSPIGSGVGAGLR